MNWKAIALTAMLAASLGGCRSGNTPGRPTAESAVNGVTDAMITTPPAGEWLTYGGDQAETRFSTLTGITDDNVDQLGLAWFADLDTARGQEATPLMHNGVLYTTTAWSMVKAYDARSGKLMWSYDPQVPHKKLVEVCCDAVNRGVALYGDKVYVGTLDGYLVALDMHSGKVVWKVRSTPEGSPMAITGAPRIAKGKVLLGSAGSEYFSRGYLAAFDAETGKEAWRFHTVPGDPSKPFEGKHLAAAAKTWTGEWWKLGGGGTVWDSITYDPVTDLVYFGTANAEPWNPEFRNKGNALATNLYTASIVAVRPETGEYVWHFQETPNDRWDYDSNQQITVADLPIGGVKRRVLLHAPKNGFFYVLDALTGKFLSGRPFVSGINWASGLDPVTGVPKVNPAARYEISGKPFTGVPGSVGAHSWTPMSFSPKTGLVYIPVNEAPFSYNGDKDWKPGTTGFQTGTETSGGNIPANQAIRAAIRKALVGRLVAFDPVAGAARWTVDYPGPTNGGILSTAGNLVFQGTSGAEFRAYTADSGELLWKFPVQSGIIAAPMTYQLDGEQYVAIMVGWGGVWDVSAGALTGTITPNISRLMVFKLNAKGVLPAPPPSARRVLDPPPFTGTPQQIAVGTRLYSISCFVCHGNNAVAGTINPDLRHSVALGNPKLWQEIVHDGLLSGNGMVAWDRQYSAQQLEAIRQYVIKRANEDKGLADY